MLRQIYLAQLYEPIVRKTQSTDHLMEVWDSEQSPACYYAFRYWYRKRYPCHRMMQDGYILHAVYARMRWLNRSTHPPSVLHCHKTSIIQVPEYDTSARLTDIYRQVQRQQRPLHAVSIPVKPAGVLYSYSDFWIVVLLEHPRYSQG